jgi:hypothetical protein
LDSEEIAAQLSVRLISIERNSLLAQTASGIAWRLPRLHVKPGRSVRDLKVLPSSRIVCFQLIFDYVPAIREDCFSYCSFLASVIFAKILDSTILTSVDPPVPVEAIYPDGFSCDSCLAANALTVT